MGKFGNTVAAVNKSLGEHTIPDWKARSMIKSYPHIPTGVISFDKASGIGGFPRGMITELFGPESCGKTTLALEAARECQDHTIGDQQIKQAVLYLDYAHDFDSRYAAKLGINLDQNWFALSQPESLEDGMRIADKFMVDAGDELGMVIVDDVASMNPNQDLEKEIGESVVASQARAVGTTIKQLRHRIKTTNSAWVFINQQRDIIETNPWLAKRGKRTTTPGGKALKFYAGMRIEFSPQVFVKKEVSTLLDDKEKVLVMQSSKFTIVKNKCFRPYTSGLVHLRPGQGYDSLTTCIEIAKALGVIAESKGQIFRLPTPYCSPDFAEQTIQGDEKLWKHFQDFPVQQANLIALAEQAIDNMMEAQYI